MKFPASIQKISFQATQVDKEMQGASSSGPSAGSEVFSAGRPVGRSAVGWSSHTVVRTLVQACRPHVWVDRELGGIRFAAGVFLSLV